MVPQVNLVPSVLTANLPQLELGPSVAGAVQNYAQGGTLGLANGAVEQVYASVVPDVIHNANMIGGNDSITVGDGNNVVFGNYGVIGALPTTGIANIDNQLLGLSNSMMGMLTQLSTLSTAQDALDVLQGHATAYTVSIGNERIAYGNGNNTIIGNVGQYLVPGVAFAPGSGTLAQSATAFEQNLLNMQVLVADLSYVAHEAAVQDISTYASLSQFSGTFNASATLRAATHDLVLDNTTIVPVTASVSGSNLLIGNNGIVIQPGINTITPNWASNASAATLASIGSQLTQMETGFNNGAGALLNSLHPFSPSNSAAAQFLFNGGAGFILHFANDTVTGAAGSNLLVGTLGVVLDPVFLGSTSAANSADLQAIMVSAIDRLFLGSYSAPSAIAAAWGATATLQQRNLADFSSAGGYVFNGPKSSVTIDSNTISTGSGYARVYAGIASLVPVIGAQPGLIQTFNAYPSGMPGVASTANYNYVLGFGPLGVLQPWQTNETEPSRFQVDANVIYGGSGINVLFGSIGDDTIYAGSGSAKISGGWGFNTIYGGSSASTTGVSDTIVYNRVTDRVILGNIRTIAASALNTTPTSPLLPASWTTTVGQTLSTGMQTSAGRSPIITGYTIAPAQTPVVPYVAPAMEAAAPTLSVTGAGTRLFAASMVPPVDPIGPSFGDLASAGFWSTSAMDQVGSSAVPAVVSEVMPAQPTVTSLPAYANYNAISPVKASDKPVESTTPTPVAATPVVAAVITAGGTSTPVQAAQNAIVVTVAPPISTPVVAPEIVTMSAALPAQPAPIVALSTAQVSGMVDSQVTAGLTFVLTSMPVTSFIIGLVQEAIVTVTSAPISISSLMQGDTGPANPQAANALLQGIDVLPSAGTAHQVDGDRRNHLAIDPALLQLAAPIRDGADPAPDIIRAIRNSEIVVRTSTTVEEPAEPMTWRFQEDTGTFTPVDMPTYAFEGLKISREQAVATPDAVQPELDTYVVNTSWVQGLRRMSREALRQLFNS